MSEDGRARCRLAGNAEYRSSGSGTNQPMAGMGDHRRFRRHWIDASFHVAPGSEADVTIHAVWAVLAGAALLTPPAGAQVPVEPRRPVENPPPTGVDSPPSPSSAVIHRGPLNLQFAGLLQSAEAAGSGDRAGGMLTLEIRRFGPWVPIARVTTVFGGREPGFMGSLQVGIRYAIEPIRNLTVAPGLALGPGLADFSGGLRFAPFGDVDLYAAYTVWRRIQVFGSVGVGWWSRDLTVSVTAQPEWVSYRRFMVGITVDPYANPRPYDEAFGER